MDAAVKATGQLRVGAEQQLAAIEEAGDRAAPASLRALALSIASNAELAAESCDELDARFKELSSGMKKVLG